MTGLQGGQLELELELDDELELLGSELLLDSDVLLPEVLEQAH